MCITFQMIINIGEKNDVANAIGGLVRNEIIVRKNRGFKINDLEKLRMLAGLT